MSHFLGTPARSHIWGLSESQGSNAVDEAKNLRKRLLSGPTVDIYVGPEKKHWSLHRNLLCHHSSYFEAEFQGHEVPKKQDTPRHRKLELADGDPRGFELLVKWLYQGHLDDASHMTDEKKYDYAVACHKLYQLCHKFDMILLKNLAMDAYRSNLHAAQLVPDANEMNDVYRNSPPKSPFRKLMAKIAARQIMDPGVKKDAETYRACFDGNADFAVEMVNAIRELSGGVLFDDPTAEENCAEWHDHRDGSACYLKGGVKSRQHLAGANVKPSALRSVKQNEDQQPVAPKSGVKRTLHIAELSSEKATPRKLNTSPQQSPVKTRPTPARKVLGPATHNSPAKLPDSQRHDRSATTKHDGQHDVNGTPRKLHSTAIRSSVTSESPKKPSNGITNGENTQSSKRFVTKPNEGPLLPKKPPKIHSNGVSDGASSGGIGADESPYLNGNNAYFDNINGIGSEAPSQSLGGDSDEAGKKQPPKLKRKAPD